MDRYNAGAAIAAVAMLAGAGAGPLSAQAQDSDWAYFEADEETDGVRLMQAGVQTANGSQLILKCDEPGQGTVVAAIFVPENLAPPSQRPPARTIRMRFDDGAVKEDAWRYYPQTAMASNTRRDRQLPRFIADLADAKTLYVTLDPVDGTRVEVTFQTRGAREAIGRIYDRCKDTNPLAAPAG